MMAKMPTLFMVALLLMLAAVPSHSQDDDPSEEMMVFDGKVVSVDIGRSTVTVEGTGTMIFTISAKTKLQKDVYGIKLSDIRPGDYVNVGYYKNDSGDIKCVSLSVDYSSSEFSPG